MVSLKLSAPLIGGFSAALLLLGLYGTMIESAPFLTSAGTAGDRLEAVEASPAIPRLSSKRALDVYEFDCRALAYDIVATGVAEDRARVDRACLERTRSLLTAAPGNSRFWLNLAQFASRLPGNEDLVLKSIRQSRLYGPWQYALAYDRLLMIFALPAAPDDITAIANADLVTLAASRKGRNNLAAWYVSSPELRDRIAAAVATRPSNQQNLFLRLIRDTLN